MSQGHRRGRATRWPLRRREPSECCGGVCAEIKDGDLWLSIQDDGIGGADSRKGSGIIGLQDRVEVLGGHIKVISPPGSGTSLHVTIPLPAE
jgi:glucose-6-phosphate-specific signal transduction histidine kinase